jgi:hypothetical protein
MPQGRLRVIAPDVGGGFGAKNAVYPEYLLAPVLYGLLARPVRSTQSRRESLVHMHHDRDQIHEVEIGFDDHGRILALSVVLTQNLGAYTDAIGMTLVGTAMLMGVGCYAIPSYEAGIRLVLTNTPPVSAYRGAGRPEASYTIERVVDHVAVATGMDPAEVRRRNFIAPAAFPYTTPAGLVYDSGDYATALDRLLSAVGYAALRAEQRRPPSHRGRPALARDRPGHVHRQGGVGPSAQMAQLYLGGWWPMLGSTVVSGVQSGDVAPQPFGAPLEEVQDQGELVDRVRGVEPGQRVATSSEVRLEPSHAFGRGFDEHTPAIHRVRVSAGESPLLEPIDQRGDGGRRQAGPLCDVAGRQGPLAFEDAHHLVVGRVEAQPFSDAGMEEDGRVAVGAPRFG